MGLLYVISFINSMCNPTYKINGKGETVKALQAILIERGYSCGSAGIDGSFGGDTEKAVKQYQRDCELEDDGYVGFKTMSAFLGV